MVFSMRIVHQSSDRLRPGANEGLNTTPNVTDSDVSGVRSGLAPATNGIGVCVPGPLATPSASLAGCRKSTGTSCRQRALPRAAPNSVSQGSV